MNSTLFALSLLTPYEIDAPKIRIGPRADGGYILLDNIVASQTVLSYGISTEYQFEEEMALRGHLVYMFDHTIEEVLAASSNMRWFKEGVAESTLPEHNLYTIGDHLSKHMIVGDRLILKMDVEGAEFAAFDGISAETLSRFEQIVVEIHGLSQLLDPSYLKSYKRMLLKLNSQFTLYHVHGNNYDGPNGIELVDGFPVSNVMELSYIKTGRYSRSRSRTLYPTALDFPNVDTKDKLLWFFPFLPTELSIEDYALCEQRIDLLKRIE